MLFDGGDKNQWKGRWHTLDYNYLLIAAQNASTSEFFTDDEEALYYVNQSNSCKYSILSKIGEIRRFNLEFYEFMLCYPDLEICNRWTQKVSPLKYTESQSCDNDKKEIGYQQIDNKFDSNRFKGLILSTSKQALLDGDCRPEQAYCRFAIGVFVPYKEKIPGPIINNRFNDVLSYELYLRIRNPYLSCDSSKIIIKSKVYILIIILKC